MEEHLDPSGQVQPAQHAPHGDDSRGKISQRWQRTKPEASTRKLTAKLILFGGRKFVEGNVTGHVY